MSNPSNPKCQQCRYNTLTSTVCLSCADNYASSNFVPTNDPSGSSSAFKKLYDRLYNIEIPGVASGSAEDRITDILDEMLEIYNDDIRNLKAELEYNKNFRLWLEDCLFHEEGSMPPQIQTGYDETMYMKKQLDESMKRNPLLWSTLFNSFGFSSYDSKEKSST